jgi:hypothetical protein
LAAEIYSRWHQQLHVTDRGNVTGTCSFDLKVYLVINWNALPCSISTGEVAPAFMDAAARCHGQMLVVTTSGIDVEHHIPA